MKHSLLLLYCDVTTGFVKLTSSQGYFYKKYFIRFLTKCLSS